MFYRFYVSYMFVMFLRCGAAVVPEKPPRGHITPPILRTWKQEYKYVSIRCINRKTNITTKYLYPPIECQHPKIVWGQFTPSKRSPGSFQMLACMRLFDTFLVCFWCSQFFPYFYYNKIKEHLVLRLQLLPVYVPSPPSMCPHPCLCALTPVCAFTRLALPRSSFSLLYAGVRRDVTKELQEEWQLFLRNSCYIVIKKAFSPDEKVTLDRCRGVNCSTYYYEFIYYIK